MSQTRTFCDSLATGASATLSRHLQFPLKLVNGSSLSTHNMFYFEPFFDLDRVNEAFRTHADAFHAFIDDVTATASGAPPFQPRMDLRENSSGIVTATFELPGMVKENVHLDAFPGRLQISADSGQDPQLEDRYAVRERRYDKFSRTLRIPLGVTIEQIKASMENGVLTVAFPKSIPDMPPKKIEIA